MTILYIRPKDPGRGSGETGPKAENENETDKKGNRRKRDDDQAFRMGPLEG
jgi:hypothetical protein